MFLLSNPPEVGNLLDLLGIEYFYIFLLFWGAILSKSSIIIFNISMGNFSLFPAQIHIFSVGSNHIFFINPTTFQAILIFLTFPRPKNHPWKWQWWCHRGIFRYFLSTWPQRSFTINGHIIQNFWKVPSWPLMNSTRWCPSSLAKLVQITPIPMVYGRYDMI